MIFVLFLAPASVLASYSSTEYEGTGSMSFTSELISDTKPDMYDQVDAFAEPCPCCEDECVDPGYYSGYQYLTNDPYNIIEDYGEVENGCISFNQEIVDYNDGNQVITTNYYTGIDGTGIAYAYVTAIPLYGYGYQYVDGSGETWVYFSQLSELDGDFDFRAAYGAGTIDCSSGILEMGNEYDLTNPYVYYNPYLLILCEDSGYSYADLEGDATDILNANVTVQTKYMSWASQIDVEGSGSLLINTESDDELDFDFEMVLG